MLFLWLAELVLAVVLLLAQSDVVGRTDLIDFCVVVGAGAVLAALALRSASRGVFLLLTSLSALLGLVVGFLYLVPLLNAGVAFFAVGALIWREATMPDADA